MYTWARSRLNRAVLSTLAAVSTGGAALRIGFEVKRLQRSRDSQVSTSRPVVPVFSRDSSQLLAGLLAERVHMLVVGPSGCGKTTTVLDAARAPASASGAVLLPFYVNLEGVIAAGGGGQVQPAVEGGKSPTPERVVQAFAAEARAFESKLLRMLSDDFAAWAWLKLSKLLPDGLSSESLSVLRQLVSPLPPEKEASLYGMLSHLAQVGIQQATLHDYARGVFGSQQLVPVIIVDEVHLLSEPELEPVLRDLLRFVQDHAHAKSAAAVTIVLLSSDAYADETVRSWGRELRRLRTLRLGDLHDSELRPFLLFLADTIKSSDGATRFRALWDGEPQQAAFRQRYGGYVSDLAALRSLYNEPGSASGKVPKKVVDSSAVAALAAAEPDRLLSMLNARSLPPRAVAAVFEAITQRGVSPRGAVTLSSLDAAGVPQSAVYAMRAANLVELRQGNTVDGHDEYEELQPLGGTPYVCATCPLARESMAYVLEKLHYASKTAEVTASALTANAAAAATPAAAAKANS